MTSHFSGQASECEVASHRYTASLAQASFPEWNLDHPTARAQSPLERGSRLACQAQDPQTSAHQRWESCDWSLLGWASDWCLSDWCLSGSGSSGLSSSRMRILWLKLIGLKLVRLSVRPQVAQSTTLCIVIQHLRWRVDICHPWSSTSQWSDEYQTWTWLTWSWKSFGKGEKCISKSNSLLTGLGTKLNSFRSLRLRLRVCHIITVKEKVITAFTVKEKVKRHVIDMSSVKQHISTMTWRLNCSSCNSLFHPLR